MWTVRTRITATVVLLSGIALAGAGVAAYVVESDRIDNRITADLAQEIDEFNNLRNTGIDPQTGQEFRTVERLTRVALQRNVPAEHEVLMGWWDGRPQLSSAPILATTLDDPAFRAAVQPLVDGDGGVTHLSTELGEVSVAVQPVSDETIDGAWVVALLENRERAEFSQVLQTYSLVAAVALLAVSVGAWSVSGRLLRPVRELRTTAREISESDLSRRIPVQGNDDISELVRTVNAMLERLEEAFAGQRRFLDDAGHELRTPVTILRGHLELLDASNPDDVQATRALLLDEIDRMSRFVDDLIVLAKSGRPDFVQPEPVDVGALTDQVLGKVSATAARDWQLDERADGDVSIDAQRITQALLQLVSNAVRHTQTGDVIAVGSGRTAGEVRWWVRDTGVGIPAEEHEAIFERFRRTTTEPSSTNSSGLGLSIVRAIAEAHGGRVEVESAPGAGATFVLTVPARAARSLPRTHELAPVPSGDRP